MTRTILSVLRGPAGRDAVGAEASIAAVAEWVRETAGPNELHTALGENFTPSLGAGLEFFQDFQGLPDGPAPLVAPTGQAMVAYGAYNAAIRKPIIAGGRLTYPDSADLGGYYQTQLKDTINLVAAGVQFTSETVGGGLACIALMSEDFVARHSASGGIPQSMMHFTLSLGGWGMDYFPTTDAPAVNIGGGAHKVNLVPEKLYHVRITIDLNARMLHVTVPTGIETYETFAVPVPAGIACRYVFIEPFKGSGAGYSRAKFAYWGADSQHAVTNIATAEAARTAQPRASYVDVAPGSIQSVTVSTVNTVIPGMSVTTHVPNGGQLKVYAEFFLDVTADTYVEFWLLNETDGGLIVRTVAGKVSHSGRVGVTMILSVGDKPGTLRTFKGAIRKRDETGAATVDLMVGGSPITAHTAFMSITPA